MEAVVSQPRRLSVRLESSVARQVEGICKEAPLAQRLFKSKRSVMRDLQRGAIQLKEVQMDDKELEEEKNLSNF